MIIPQGLKDDQNFELLSTPKDSIEAKDLAFYLSPYKHCGPGCGNFSSQGGGTPINRIDSCCRSHNRCWHNFGANDPCRDRDIDNCVQQNGTVDPVTSGAIQATFLANSYNC